MGIPRASVMQSLDIKQKLAANVRSRKRPLSSFKKLNSSTGRITPARDSRTTQHHRHAKHCNNSIGGLKVTKLSHRSRRHERGLPSTCPYCKDISMVQFNTGEMVCESCWLWTPPKVPTPEDVMKTTVIDKNNAIDFIEEAKIYEDSTHEDTPLLALDGTSDGTIRALGTLREELNYDDDMKIALELAPIDDDWDTTAVGMDHILPATIRYCDQCCNLPAISCLTCEKESFSNAMMKYCNLCSAWLHRRNGPLFHKQTSIVPAQSLSSTATTGAPSSDATPSNKAKRTFKLSYSPGSPVWTAAVTSPVNVELPVATDEESFPTLSHDNRIPADSAFPLLDAPAIPDPIMTLYHAELLETEESAEGAMNEIETRETTVPLSEGDVTSLDTHVSGMTTDRLLSDPLPALEANIESKPIEIRILSESVDILSSFEGSSAATISPRRNHKETLAPLIIRPIIPPLDMNMVRRQQELEKRERLKRKHRIQAKIAETRSKLVTDMYGETHEFPADKDFKKSSSKHDVGDAGVKETKGIDLGTDTEIAAQVFNNSALIITAKDTDLKGLIHEDVKPIDEIALALSSSKNTCDAASEAEPQISWVRKILRSLSPFDRSKRSLSSSIPPKVPKNTESTAVVIRAAAKRAVEAIIGKAAAESDEDDSDSGSSDTGDSEEDFGDDTGEADYSASSGRDELEDERAAEPRVKLKGSGDRTSSLRDIMRGTVHRAGPGTGVRPSRRSG